MIKCIVGLLLVIGVLIVLNILFGLVVAFWFRRCPYCGRKMKHDHNRYDADGKVEKYVFYCPHCGAWEDVMPTEMLREQEQS